MEDNANLNSGESKIVTKVVNSRYKIAFLLKLIVNKKSLIFTLCGYLAGVVTFVGAAVALYFEIFPRDNMNIPSDHRIPHLSYKSNRGNSTFQIINDGDAPAIVRRVVLKSWFSCIDSSKIENFETSYEEFIDKLANTIAAQSHFELEDLIDQRTDRTHRHAFDAITPGIYIAPGEIFTFISISPEYKKQTVELASRKNIRLLDAYSYPFALYMGRTSVNIEYCNKSGQHCEVVPNKKIENIC